MLLDLIGTVSSARDGQSQVCGSKKDMKPYSTYIFDWRPSRKHREDKEDTRPRHPAGGRVTHMKEEESYSTKLLGLEPSDVTKGTYSTFLLAQDQSGAGPTYSFCHFPN